MKGTAGVGRARERGTTLAVVLGALIGLGLIAAAIGGAADRAPANKTYGLTTKTNAKFVSKVLPLKKPSKVTHKAGSYFVKATRIKRFMGWGSDQVSAPVGKLKICDDVVGKKKKGCSTAAGTISFDFLDSRKCKVGKKKRKVWLYGRTIFDQEPTTNYPSGRGVGFQYGFPDSGQPAECPKF